MKMRMMDKLNSKLYMVQPDMVKQIQNYRSYLIFDDTISQIYRFSLEKQNEFSCTAIQDASVDIIFYKSHQGNEHGVLIVGPSKELENNYVKFKGGYCYIGVRFKPGCPLSLQHMKGENLYGRILNLDSQKDDYEQMAVQFNKIIEGGYSMNRFRQKIYHYISKPEDKKAKLCNEIINYMMKANTNFQCTKMADDFGYTAYYINKIFHSFTGYSVKGYYNLLRIHRVLNYYETGCKANSIPQYSHLALDFGFSDQAHMIREFKKYVGVSPHRFWKQKYENSGE